MYQLIAEQVRTFLSLFAITDPIGMIPIFLAITINESEHQRKHTLMMMHLTAMGLLVGAALVGERFLGFFGIGIAQFRIAGGILLFLIALDMLHARMNRTRQVPEEHDEGVQAEHVAIVPLAIPLFAGPGAISTVILFSQERQTPYDEFLLCLTIVAVCASSWLILKLAQPIGKLLGCTGLNITIRLMGLLLAAIGVDFFLKGLMEFFPQIRPAG